MTFLLRAALVIGVIFYFSPVRRPDDGMGAGTPARHANHASPGDALLAEILARSVTGAEAPPGVTAEAERLWRSLPPGTQRALLDRIRAAAAMPPERPVSAADPARNEDRHPATRHAEPPRRP